MLKRGFVADPIDEAVVAELEMLMEDKEEQPALLSPDSALNADLGLSSLDLAELVAVLEVELELDPFRDAVPITSIRTVGDLLAAYRTVRDGGDAGSGGLDDALARARQMRDRRKGGA